MKVTTSALLAVLAISPAFAATAGKFYGNVLVTGTQGCSVVQGSFPIEASFASGASPFFFNILIQNQSIGLPLDFVDVTFVPAVVVGGSGGTGSSTNGSATVYDYALFNTYAGQSATYTGTPILTSAGTLRVDGNGTPLVLTQTAISGSPPPCVLSFTGVLYPSPN